ncbi:MAG: hypothetical protein PHW82_11200, partial [Bacteroidales bacterium]|nr:hypothetical protein [Bacteroidales bacterium]
IGGFEVYRKYVNSSLDTERETVHISEARDRFAMIDRLTVENGTTLTTPVETLRYQYNNHLGTACLELDGSADIISYEEYHPFGTTSYRSGRNEVDVSLKRYKYVGKERDEETGLYYYGARYYAAWLARFVSCDPLQHEYPHYTPFQYAGNKPITYIDLDGLEEYNPKGANPELYVGDNNNTCTSGTKLNENPFWENSTQSSSNKAIPEKNAGYNSFNDEVKEYIDIYENEAKLRLIAVQEEMSILDPNSDKYKLLEIQYNEYAETISEISEIKNDPNIIIEIYYGSDLPENVGGEVMYGGKIGTKTVLEIHFETQIKNPLLNIGVFAHEFKHVHQYVEGRLGFIINNDGKTVLTSNSKELETEAGKRGEFFSGKTITNNRSFNMYYDPSTFILPSAYKDYAPKTYPAQFPHYAKKHGYTSVFNK